MFAVTQIALSFVLLAGAGMLLAALVSLQTANTGYDMRQVLALDVPLPLEALGAEVDRLLRGSDAPDRAAARRRQRVAVGNFVPWRDAGTLGPGFQFAVEGYTPADGEENPHARLRIVAPGFFAALGVPIVAGRDFTDEDRARHASSSSIVSQSVAQRLFPNGDALNQHLWWTDPYFGKPAPRRIVGIVADVDDENVVPGAGADDLSPVPADPAWPAACSCTRRGDPYALVDAGDARSSARCRRTSRWSAPPRSRTCARRCWRPSG